ncbi:MAG: geranylgeranylglycerol-phosphate geranylgeranyltransferase [Chitinophagales bacterium]|nr:geranylgeranylglycerol-phosphate geranylgeranyltransferase [Chitinophagales bacterium]
MKGIISFLRLIRVVNLLYIALTQWLVQYTIIRPILAQAGVETTLDVLHFSLLMLSTVLIAAGGYVINDYFDVKIDAVNKPRRIFIDRTIKRRSAMLLHQFLSGAGIMLGFYVAWKAGNVRLGFIHPIVAALLWFYSTGYKRQLLIGNVIISLLTALVILIVALYEQHLFKPENAAVNAAAYSIFIIVFFYFLFAFLISMMREIVKDMEDVEGDRRYGCKTLPVVIGINRSKWLVFAIAVLMTAFLVYLQLRQAQGGDFISVLNVFTMLELPLCLAMYLLYKADAQKQFSLVSSVIKIIMLMGILMMVYFYYLMGH